LENSSFENEGVLSVTLRWTLRRLTVKGNTDEVAVGRIKCRAFMLVTSRFGYQIVNY
jgi:hypothetical protein